MAARRIGVCERGYAMAALLVSIAVLMVLMSVAMPVWRTQSKREKEAELIFRGEQYARAVNLYTRKMGPGNFPPSIDVLVQQHFLRKKYKDPMTEDGEFDIITAASAAGQPGSGGRGPQPQPQPQPQRGMSIGPSTGLSAPPQPFGRGGSQGGGRGPSPSPFGSTQGSFGAAPGGIMGVRSKSKDTSFRVYNGATHYNEWAFLFSSVSSAPGGGRGAAQPGMAPGASPFNPGVGGRGGRGPGGRGGPAPPPPPPPPPGFGPGMRGIGRGRG
jgi:type II secretory pathway pseudopilin PulG